MADDRNETREHYPHFAAIQTRWSDNDLYGHVNNVTYYSYFDTVVNRFLIEEGGLDIFKSPEIGITVQTKCRFRRPVAYPEALEAGLRVAKLGDSSVRYEIGIFRPGDEEPVAYGYFVHVFVERATGAPVTIPDSVRTALKRILVATPGNGEGETG